ncbi:hypothetical protein BH23ACT11_BH23ACT11_13100 [soil metagenome]
MKFIMRRKITLVLATSVASVLMVAGPAFAHGAGPCDDSGGPGNSDYAAHHITVLAQDQALGDGGHKPGSHQGFSLCNPSGK